MWGKKKKEQKLGATHNSVLPFSAHACMTDCGYVSIKERWVLQVFFPLSIHLGCDKSTFVHLSHEKFKGLLWSFLSNRLTYLFFTGKVLEYYKLLADKLIAGWWVKKQGLRHSAWPGEQEQVCSVCPGQGTMLLFLVWGQVCKGLALWGRTTSGDHMNR